MEAEDDLVDRADTLIRRQRSAAAPFSPAVRRTPADDLPLLTEVVEGGATQAPMAIAGDDEAFNQALIEIAATELAQAIEHRLRVELPSLVEATLITLREDLGRGIAAATEAALRDFLGRHAAPTPPAADAPND